MRLNLETFGIEVKEIVDTAHEHALAILRQNQELLETIASQLLETEVIEGETLQGLLGRVQSPGQANASHEVVV